MKSRRIWRTGLIALGILAGAWAFAALLLPVLWPFLIGLAVSLLAEKPVRLLQTRARFPRWLASGVCVLTLFVLCYPRIFAVTFDETFSRATGVHTQAYNMLLAVLTAVTIVLGMRMMGALLISSLIIFPALTAMRVFGTFRSVTICAAVVSVVNFLLGMVLSYVLETPSGASVVVVDLVVFLLFCGVQRIQCRVKK